MLTKVEIHDPDTLDGAGKVGVKLDCVLKERQGNGWAFLVLSFIAKTVSLEGLERRRRFLFKRGIELLHRRQ